MNRKVREPRFFTDCLRSIQNESHPCLALCNLSAKCYVIIYRYQLSWTDHALPTWTTIEPVITQNQWRTGAEQPEHWKVAWSSYNCIAGKFSTISKYGNKDANWHSVSSFKLADYPGCSIIANQWPISCPEPTTPLNGRIWLVGNQAVRIHEWLFYFSYKIVPKLVS